MSIASSAWAADLRGLFAQGRSAAEAGRHDDAVKLLQRVVDAAPDWALPRLELAEIHLYGDGDHAEAARHLEVALRHLPRNPRAHLLRGMQLEAAGDDAGAVRSYQAAYELRADLRGLRRRLAFALARTGQRRAAIEHHAALVAETPSDLSLRLSLANLLEYERRHDEAREQHEAVLSQQPGSALALRRYARFLARIGDGNAAAEATARADALAPPPRSQRPEMRPLPKSRR